MLELSCNLPKNADVHDRSSEGAGRVRSSRIPTSRIPALDLPAVWREAGAVIPGKFMKNRIFAKPLRAMAGLTLMVVCGMSVAAENSPAAITNPAPNTTGTTVPSQTSPVKLSPGAQDVLNLATARVSENTIVPFIENSGTIYNLSAAEIIYLKEQGVTDRVITTMLNQRQKVMVAGARVGTSTAAVSPQYSQPATAQVQTSTAYVAPSTVYVVPNSSPEVYYDYYDYYPRYGGYYGYYYPPVSFSFGFGSGWRGGGYYGGGYHGGGSHWGGSHGGGGHGGGGHGGGHR